MAWLLGPFWQLEQYQEGYLGAGSMVDAYAQRKLSWGGGGEKYKSLVFWC